MVVVTTLTLVYSGVFNIIHDFLFFILLLINMQRNQSYTSSSQMLQIQLQMVQRGVAAYATNNENSEHAKND